MATTVCGIPGPHKIASRPIWRRGEGYAWEDVYEGTVSEIDGLFVALQNDADEIVKDQDGPTARLYVRSNYDPGSGTETPQTTWELLGNDVPKDLFEHPKTKALDNDEVAAVKKDLLAVEQDGKDFTQTATESDALTLFGLYHKGTQQYLTSDYVLRKTQVVSSRYTTKVGFSGVLNLWTTTQINNAESIPAAIAFSVTDIPSLSEPTGFKHRWLKKTPTVTQVAGYRFQIQQEWWLGLWSTWIYTEYS